MGTACESPAWELRRCCLGCRGGGGRPRRCSSWQRGKAGYSPAYFRTRASVSRVGREVLKIIPHRSRGGPGGNAIPRREGRGGPGQSPGPGRELGPAVGCGGCGKERLGNLWQCLPQPSIPAWRCGSLPGGRPVMGERPGSTLTSLRSWLVCHFPRCTGFLF